MINTIVNKITHGVNLWISKRNWRKNNKHNFTIVANLFPLEKVSVGKKTYGRLNIKTYGNIHEQLIIGSYCSIAEDVKFLLGGEHPYNGLSTYPFKRYICGQKEETITKGTIYIEDDVWIGENSLILSGVTIGQGAVIAAGSIVAKDIPPYAIFAGGEIKKYRFSQEVIEQLLEVDFSKLDDEMIKNQIDYLYSKLDSNTLRDDLSKLFKQSGV
ncbi:CatB-related O-acetyltransferase [Mesobacillus sp. LC4]